MTVVPAYSRDYRSLKAAKADWNLNKDFIIADIFNPYDGKPCNKQDCKGQTIVVRYDQLRKIGRLQ